MTSTRTGASSCLLRCTRPRARTRTARARTPPPSRIAPAVASSPGTSARTGAAAGTATGATTRAAAAASATAPACAPALLLLQRVALVDVGVEPVGGGRVARPQPRADLRARRVLIA